MSRQVKVNNLIVLPDSIHDTVVETLTKPEMFEKRINGVVKTTNGFVWQALRMNEYEDWTVEILDIS